MQEVIQIHPEDVKKVQWTGDHFEYDSQLYNLGIGHSAFMVVNPWTTNTSSLDYVDTIPVTNKCIVWKYKDEWIAKYFSAPWSPDAGYETIEIIKPNLSWSKNPDFDKLMTFENDPYGKFVPDYWDSAYKLVWYIDPKVNPLPDQVWAISCQPLGKEIKGIKDMGYIMPNINVEYNPDLPAMGIDVDQCYPAFWEISNECAWELDSIHTPEKRMWAIKFSPAYRKPKTWSWYGTISPNYRIEYNRDLPKLKFDVDYIIPWHDLAYVHTWYLAGKEKIWAVKMSATNDPIGEKEMSILTPEFPEHLDVIFISYNEPNAESNWQRVLEKAPWAKRIDGVKGIFEAHKAAAKLSTTDMFYVVDGDAYLVDDMNFDFQPTIHDRDCTHIWRAKNPINELVYGYGGVKLFSKKVLIKAKKWVTLDLSTSIVSKIKIVDVLSNITAFDTDELSVWRSTFRECVKLSYNVLQDSKDTDSQLRLQHWLDEGSNHKFGKYAMDAASCAVEWATNNRNDYDMLRMINDRTWIETQFNKRIFT